MTVEDEWDDATVVRHECRRRFQCSGHEHCFDCGGTIYPAVPRCEWADTVSAADTEATR